MAKLKKSPPTVELQYFAYYDPDTEQILAVTNEPVSNYTHWAVITSSQHRDIMKGTVNLRDCLIDRYIKADGNIEAKLITKQLYEEFTFKNKSFTWINDAPADSTEFVVEYNKQDRQWTFAITQAGRDNLADKSMNNTLVFFVMLETDFDFLIRTVYLQIYDLLRTDKIRIDFESEIENRIELLSIASKTFFNSYGLKIND